MIKSRSQLSAPPSTELQMQGHSRIEKGASFTKPTVPLKERKKKSAFLIEVPFLPPKDSSLYQLNILSYV